MQFLGRQSCLEISDGSAEAQCQLLKQRQFFQQSQHLRSRFKPSLLSIPNSMELARNFLVRQEAGSTQGAV
jgi:hypothetical protein